MGDEREENNHDIIAEQEITDEMRIQFGIDKFYELTEIFDQSQEHIRKLKHIRNNLINMMDTYLKKFQNDMIMKSFYDKLFLAKKIANNNGHPNKYYQYMLEIRVIQEFKGIRENIADKLADQLFEMVQNSEMITDA